MSVARAFAFLAMLSSCERSDVASVPLPPLGSARSMIAAVEEAENIRSLVAARVDHADPVASLPVPEGAGDEVRALALLYDSSLADLGLEPGPIPRDDGLGVAIPRPREAFLWSLAADDPWQPFTPTDALLASHPIVARSSPCARFRAEFFGLDTNEMVETGFVLDDGAVIIATSGQRYYRVDASGPVQIERLIPDARICSSFRRSPREVWLGGEGGRLYRGDPSSSEPFVRVTSSPLGRALAWIDGADEGEALEIYALDQEGAFQRFDGTAWSNLFNFNEGAQWGGVAWISPGEAIAVNASVHAVMRFRDGALSSETPGDDRDGFASSEQIASAGTLLGGARGNIYGFSEGSWHLLGHPGAFSQVHTIAPFASGFLVGGNFGLLAQYHPEVGFCDQQQLAPSHVRLILAMPDAWFVAYDSRLDAGATTQIAWLTLEPSP